MAQRYRLCLFEDGASHGEPTADAQSTRKKRKGFSHEEVEREQDRDGQLSIATIASCRSRYFVEGAVLGSKAWVNNVIDGLKGDYLKPDRKTGSSKPKGKLKKSGLWSLRHLSEE